MSNSVAAEHKTKRSHARHRSGFEASAPQKSPAGFTNIAYDHARASQSETPVFYEYDGVYSETTEKTPELMAADSALSEERTRRERIEGLLLATQHQLQIAMELANAASSAKAAFLANMSHEIRTPLGAVLGLSELLLTEDQTPSERGRIIEAIKRNGQTLLMVIDDILDLSNIEAGKIEVEKVEVDLADILTDIRLSLSLKVADKGLQVELNPVSPLPHKITTDPVRLRQILSNIIGNAVKFTDHGTITVKIKQIINENGRKLLGFEVTDTGRGISAEQSKLLFKPFSQADSSTTRPFGGTGLGLALAKNLANALDGNVEILQSALGQGSTFVISIDPGEATWVDNVATVTEAKGSNSLRGDFSLGRCKNMKLLLVEDAPENRLLFTYILQTAGIDVDTAVDGREGVKKALQGKYSLILMDLQMPELDGYAATRELRQAGYKSPIVALTAHAMKEEKQRCLAAGFDGHLSKPISRHALLQSLVAFHDDYATSSALAGG